MHILQEIFHDGCQLRSFNGKSGFACFVNHFTAMSYFLPANLRILFINYFEAILSPWQDGISNSRNGFFTSIIFGRIINYSFLSKVTMKSCMTLSVNCHSCTLLWLLWSPYRNLMVFFGIHAYPLKWCFDYNFSEF